MAGPSSDPQNMVGLTHQDPPRLTPDDQIISFVVPIESDDMMPIQTELVSIIVWFHDSVLFSNVLFVFCRISPSITVTSILNISRTRRLHYLLNIH